MTPTAPAATPGDGAAPTASRIGHIAAALASEHFPARERAALRRQNPGSPPALAFYRFAFKHLPPDWEIQHDAWAAIVSGLALARPPAHRPDRPAGRMLAEAGYSEKWLERLLAAEGAALHGLLLRAARLLAAKELACDWAQFARLLLSTGEDQREAARLAIAREFYRNFRNKR